MIQTLYGQADSVALILEPVTVSANRIEEQDLKIGGSIAIKNESDFQTGSRQLSIFNGLQGVSGVFVLNQSNYSKDLRVAIRGNGAGASFGIRGVRIFTDGFPEGTPDGQVDVDNIDAGIINQMEVLKGAASSLYGNAAGGVILLKTEMPSKDNPIQVFSAQFGSYGFNRQLLKLGRANDKMSFLLTASHNDIKGYRENSSMKNSVLNFKWFYKFSSFYELKLFFNYGFSPIAQDPGSVTYENYEKYPFLSFENNLKFEAGENINQGRFGIELNKEKDKSEISFRSFYTRRQINNRLPIQINGIGEVNRDYYGFYGSYQYKLNKNFTLKSGGDYSNQKDHRKRYSMKLDSSNLSHYIQDKIVLNQFEFFNNLGLYLILNSCILDRVNLSFSIRYDNLKLKLNDKYLDDGLQSGSRAYNKLNPSLGVNGRIWNQNFTYARVASSFESPTLNELGNNPSGLGGFNTSLNPKTSISYEIGFKGISNNSKIKYDFCYFLVYENNSWVPYELANFPGKTFYRNSGKVNKNGLEFSLSVFLLKALQLNLNSSFNKFIYKSYNVDSIDFSGKFLAGLPSNFSFLSLNYSGLKNFKGILTFRYNTKIFANDANTDFAKAYSLANLNFAYLIKASKLNFEFNFGLNNIFNKKYVDNIVINAFGKRYYEAGMPRNVFGGLKIRVN